MLLSATPAFAGSVLDRVRATGVVQCGAAQRAGFASTDQDGVTAGLAVDLCRAVAVAVLGPQARIAFRVYGDDADFAGVRSGADQIAFLSGADIAARTLAGAVMPGPAVFFDWQAVMVPQGSAARDLADLSGATVCFMIASAAQRALEQDAARLHLAFARLGFEEEVEMLDAYDVGRCQAVVGEATTLSAYRRTPGVNGLRSRILARPLALLPVLAAAPTGDGEWAALVGWVLNAVMLADRAETPWAAAGAAALPFAPAALGLRPGWLEAVRGATGFYRAMFNRNLGNGSPLRLAPGPNALWPDGLLAPAAAE